MVLYMVFNGTAYRLAYDEEYVSRLTSEFRERREEITDDGNREDYNITAVNTVHDV